MATYTEAGGKPPCKRCHPGVHPFNEAAVTVYEECENQYLSGPNSILGLNLAAVEVAFNWHDVDPSERSEMWNDIRVIVGALIEACTKEAEEKARMEKAKRT